MIHVGIWIRAGKTKAGNREKLGFHWCLILSEMNRAVKRKQIGLFPMYLKVTHICWIKFLTQVKQESCKLFKIKVQFEMCSSWIGVLKKFASI